jgi:hypothetical protein
LVAAALLATQHGSAEQALLCRKQATNANAMMAITAQSTQTSKQAYPLIHQQQSQSSRLCAALVGIRVDLVLSPGKIMSRLCNICDLKTKEEGHPYVLNLCKPSAWSYWQAVH